MVNFRPQNETKTTPKTGHMVAILVIMGSTRCVAYNKAFLASYYISAPQVV